MYTKLISEMEVYVVQFIFDGIEVAYYNYRVF